MELKLHPFMNILAFDSANPDGRRQLVALCRPPRPPGSRLIPLKYGWKGETERGGGPALADVTEIKKKNNNNFPVSPSPASDICQMSAIRAGAKL